MKPKPKKTAVPWTLAHHYIFDGNALILFCVVQERDFHSRFWLGETVQKSRCAGGSGDRFRALRFEGGPQGAFHELCAMNFHRR